MILLDMGIHQTTTTNQDLGKLQNTSISNHLRQLRYFVRAEDVQDDR